MYELGVGILVELISLTKISSRLTNDERAESFSDFTTASLVGEFGMLGGGPIGFAAVVEYQDMGYDSFPSQAVVDGLLWGTGYVQSGGSRDRQAAGVEFRYSIYFRIYCKRFWKK